MKLDLKGTFPKGLPLLGGAKNFSKKLSKVFEEKFGDMTPYVGTNETPDGYVLQIQAHPACGPLNVYIVKPNHILVQAGVGVTGPGYHQFLADAIRDAGNTLKIQWEKSPESDPTGYFFSPNRDALERYYLRFLQESVEEIMKDPGGAIYMPFPHEFEFEGDVATPLGPRTMEWIRAVAQDPSRGMDIFSWWDEGKGANYHLGRALAILWNHARYRQPLSQYEQIYYADMLDSFEQAYKLAPSMHFPWREWLSFLKMTKRPPMDPLMQAVTRQASMEDQNRPLMGYRQRDFRIVLPSGWSFVMPGIMAEEIDEEGMWQGWDGARTIQVGEMPVPPEIAMTQSPEQLIALGPPLGPGGLGEELNWSRNEVLSKGNLHQSNEEGRIYWRLGSIVAARGSVLIFTINFDHAKDREWALGVWNSLEYQKPEEDEE